ncbi:MAG: nicotinate-nucleotide--dimethylbenzimidazole phosphoribosyltransferase [Pseudomonadota bacterium]
MFDTLQDLRAQLAAAPKPDDRARDAAAARDATLTKPPGSLGRLEEIAVWLAGWQARAIPRLEAAQVVIFAGNHGVAARGVSAFPAEVTAQMTANFRAGGAAINQLAGLAGARLDVFELALDTPTADFTQAPAMTEAEMLEALNVGAAAVDPAADLIVPGEMGIGNTTAAAAIAAALFGGGAAAWVGRGTGIDDAGLATKQATVAAGLDRHADVLADPLEVLRCLGGREIAAMCGAIAMARIHGTPVLLDGFIAGAAAAVLSRAVPGALDHAMAGHVSAEAGHAALLAKLNLDPLLSLGLRLGEGSGAALAILILRAALACHGGMATFEEAGLSTG